MTERDEILGDMSGPVPPNPGETLANANRAPSDHDHRHSPYGKPPAGSLTMPKDRNIKADVKKHVDPAQPLPGTDPPLYPLSEKPARTERAKDTK